MNLKRENMLALPAAFVQSVGEQVCRSSELTVKFIAQIISSGIGYIKKSLSPFHADTKEVLKKIIRTPFMFAAKKKEQAAAAADTFKRRSKIFGIRRALIMQWKECMLAAKRSNAKPLVTLFNVAFPTACVAVLVLCVNSVMSTDYGVAVEYEGEEIGVVTGEDVLGEAQCVVADRVKYYDTKGDYFVTATLAIKPIASNDSVIDQNVLAQEMENRISMRYDEKSVQSMESAADAAVAEVIGDKVKAYKVRVDGEVIGVVDDYSDIEQALEQIKRPFDNGEYVEIDFDKDIEYDLEEYVEPEEIVSDDEIISTLTGYESAPEYYEVQPGDNLWKIADAKGMTLEDLSGCYATYNGQVIEDLENSILRVGTLIQLESEMPYLQVECKKEQTLRSKIEYETITIEDSNLPSGQVKVESEGQDGEKFSRVMVTYRDGVAVRKRTLDTIIVTQPISEIIRVGTGNGINYDAPEFITDGGTGDYFWPVDGGYISAHQGDGRGHKGIDIAAPYGTPIYAAASGEVTDAGTGWNSGYGNCLVIENDDGNVTVYAHQSELVAQLGDYVEKGQLIGYVGSTGDSTGNHLHFEIRKDGKYYDPEKYVAQ